MQALPRAPLRAEEQHKRVTVLRRQRHRAPPATHRPVRVHHVCRGPACQDLCAGQGARGQLRRDQGILCAHGSARARDHDSVLRAGPCVPPVRSLGGATRRTQSARRARSEVPATLSEHGMPRVLAWTEHEPHQGNRRHANSALIEIAITVYFSKSYVFKTPQTHLAIRMPVSWTASWGNEID